VAATSLLALIDDISTVLDDVATMTKVATKKTAGVLGDDLALNAEQVSGVTPDRELQVVWAVAKGSLVNKLILVPSALALSAFAPWAIVPVLMVGGLFLCFEGFEKVMHALWPHAGEGTAGEPEADTHAAPPLDEAAKIKGAVRTDFILSAEIVVIALGTIASAPFAQQVAVLVAVGLGMTVFVYGLVAGIVKLDDLGLALVKRGHPTGAAIGRAILKGAPYLMRGLSIAGTVAMFLVGGGILTHGIPGLEGLTHGLEGSALGAVAPTALNALVGVVAGGLVVGALTLVKRVRR
jgi:predicted DNA repair protein MutK